MSRKVMKPGYYRTPLRARSDIAAYLASVGGYYSTYARQGRSYFAFNVKCYNANLDFERLIEVNRNGGYYGDGESWLDNLDWLEQARTPDDAPDPDSAFQPSDRVHVDARMPSGDRLKGTGVVVRCCPAGEYSNAEEGVIVTMDESEGVEPWSCSGRAVLVDADECEGVE